MPWARPENGFTLMLEAFVMALTWEMPMSAACQKGVREHLPDARIVFDRFQVMQLPARRWTRCSGGSSARVPQMKGALWALRGNQSRLSQAQLELRHELCARHKELARAMALRENLKAIRYWMAGRLDFQIPRRMAGKSGGGGAADTCCSQCETHDPSNKRLSVMSKDRFKTACTHGLKTGHASHGLEIEGGELSAHPQPLRFAAQVFVMRQVDLRGPAGGQRCHRGLDHIVLDAWQLQHLAQP